MARVKFGDGSACDLCDAPGKNQYLWLEFVDTTSQAICMKCLKEIMSVTFSSEYGTRNDKTP